MQIFILDSNPKLAAKLHANIHTSKQTLEICQLLCTTMRLHNINYGYMVTHKNHPCRLWLDESKENFNWLKSLGIELSKEYTYRYGKVHKSTAIIKNSYCPADIPDKNRTPFAVAMDPEYRIINNGVIDVVASYRNYYKKAKRHLLIYTRRDVPKWLDGIARKKEWVDRNIKKRKSG